jgi:hypothetical protein
MRRIRWHQFFAVYQHPQILEQDVTSPRLLVYLLQEFVERHLEQQVTACAVPELDQLENRYRHSYGLTTRTRLPVARRTTLATFRICDAVKPLSVIRLAERNGLDFRRRVALRRRGRVR